VENMLNKGADGHQHCRMTHAFLLFRLGTLAPFGAPATACLVLLGKLWPNSLHTHAFVECKICLLDFQAVQQL
jgi:hypothetical protein